MGRVGLTEMEGREAVEQRRRTTKVSFYMYGKKPQEVVVCAFFSFLIYSPLKKPRGWCLCRGPSHGKLVEIPLILLFLQIVLFSTWSILSDSEFLPLDFPQKVVHVAGPVKKL